MSAATPARLRHARMAVSALFLVNGAGWANVLPRLPAIKDQLDLTNASLGAAIAAGPIGGVVAGVFVGLLVARFGSGPVAVACGLISASLLAGVGLAPAWLALAALLFVLGALDAVMDAAMNAHGVVVQRGYGRSILHGFHGWWSCGTLLGGATGAVTATLDIPLPIHLAVVAMLLFATTLIASRFLLGGREVDAHATEEPGAGVATTRHPLRLLRLLAPVAVAGLLGVLMEDAAQTWSSVYLADVLRASAGVAALGYVLYTAMMTLGRLTNDRWIDRWGNVAVARGGSLLASAGLGVVAVGGFLGILPLAIGGFALVGLGVSPVFPVMVDAAGHRPGVRSADGIATVSWTARFAFFIAPLLIGVTGDAFGLATALLIPLAAGLAAVVAAGAFAPRVERPRKPVVDGAAGTG